MSAEFPRIPTPKRQVKEKNQILVPMTEEGSFRDSPDVQKNSSEYQKKKEEFFGVLDQYTVELRDEQTALLMTVREGVEVVLKKHGVLREMEDVVAHIHLVRPDFYKDCSRIMGENPMTDKEAKQIGGAYSSHFGEIVLTWKATETHSEFATKAAHEVLHFFQIDNRKKGKGEDSLGQESLGMMLEGDGRMLFGNMLEATTQKLTMEAIRDIQDPVIVEERRKLKELFGKGPEEGYFMGYQVRGKFGYVHEYIPRIAYEAQLKKFDEMMVEIYEKNKGQFQSTAEVFEVFVQAAYGGEKLPLARLIHRTYGVKSEVLKAILKFFGKESPLRAYLKR